MKNNLKNKRLWFFWSAGILLLVFHTRQYILSDFDVRPLLNIIMTAIFFPMSLIFGEECLSYFLVVYCFFWIPFEEFDSYTSLFLLCTSISLNKKLWRCFIPYAAVVFICYMDKGWEISHIGITLIYTLVFWVIYVMVQSRKSNFKPLELKQEEEKILIQLCNGKEIKEIEPSPSTVYRRLRDAMERNDCISIDELKTRYKYNDKTMIQFFNV